MVDRVNFDPPDHYGIRDIIRSWKYDYNKFLQLFFRGDKTYKSISYEITKRTNDIIKGSWEGNTFIIFKDIGFFVCEEDGILYWHKIKDSEFKKRNNDSWSEYWSRMPTGMSINDVEEIREVLEKRYI